MVLNKSSKIICICCKSKKSIKVKIFNKPPYTEPKYKINNYFRQLYKCKVCGHFTNISKVNMNKIYVDR